ncbi:uncharacterized protein EDB93DRAFT_1273293 [Suillus bovinus]|uniref:uncharacterized protein n=1 Tax=Suillus bovinus TaxID=48563 RepID=UPI001B864EEA|nr:uncharacterized protein EDB93DRAFT_1273293 [Suillus bovinus]KAG2152595.1 hypothetical protein EDB93DRAFT_1273293 [Suillus bovinus]
MPVSTITVASTGSKLYKSYQTRSNSALQATSRTSVKSTGSVQKFNLTPKPLTPVLQLSKTESAACRKTSSTPLQEAQEAHKASVNIITENPSPNPLYDDLADDDDDDDDDDSDNDDDDSQQFHCYHHLTSNGRKVVKKISKLPPETGRTMEFHDVGAREYEAIEDVLGEMGWTSKPRLTYDYEKTSLLVEMPSAIHEAPFDCLKLSLGNSIAAMPYDNDLIFPMVHMNSLLSVKEKSVTPDICITVTPAVGPTKIVLVPFVGECTCSEDKAHAIGKLKDTIATHHDTQMAVLGLIHEA